MVTIKSKVTGMYNGVCFKAGEVVTFSEASLKGLDPRDYVVIQTAEAVQEDDEATKKKQVKNSADKMQRPVATK